MARYATRDEGTNATNDHRLSRVADVEIEGTRLEGLAAARAAATRSSWSITC